MKEKNVWCYQKLEGTQSNVRQVEIEIEITGYYNGFHFIINPLRYTYTPPVNRIEKYTVRFSLITFSSQRVIISFCRNN